jgi:biopolymer transport protein ExbB
MIFRAANPWCTLKLQRLLPAASLIAALGWAVVFWPADVAQAQTDQVAPAAPTQAAPVGSGEIPQSTMNSSTPSVANDMAPAESVKLPPVSTSHPATPLASLPHDLSPWGMFLAADMVVKVVMVGLAFASLITWTVGLAKGIELMLAKRRVHAGLRKLASEPTLHAASEAFEHKRGPVRQMVNAAFAEAERSAGLHYEGIKDRASALLTRIELRAGRAMQRGTGVLATIGATAPFVGLFGTVWGIMNSFIGISKANTTNLAVVAPGIAEALLATAIGLVAAVPAVVIYNLLARAITSYRALLADTSTEVMRHLSRDLDRQLFAQDDDDPRVIVMRRSAE